MNKNEEVAFDDASTSWCILTSDNFKGVEIEDVVRKEKKESIELQDNQESNDYIWINM